jgi:hypothetical protein
MTGHGAVRDGAIDPPASGGNAPKGAVMPICNILEDRNQSAEQADQIRDHVRGTGPVPPEGARLMLAGPSDAGYRVITVWDSEEARDRFYAERLAPAYEEAGLSLDDATRTQFDVAVLMAGDLTGAAVA